MMPSPSISYTLAALITVGSLGPALYTRARAAGESAAASSRLARVQLHADMLASARATLPSWAIADSAAARPQEAIASRVSAAVAAAGLPASAIASVSVQTDSEAAGTPGFRIERRRATLVLSQLTLPQLGAFLDAWRRTHADWIPASIDASPEAARSDKPPAPGADLPLHIVIQLDSLALQPVPASPSRR